MIAVIADDITGAAEIAGIGLRFGLKTNMTLNDVSLSAGKPDLLVYATDTRSKSEEEAVTETRNIIKYLQTTGYDELFKKTDSALRGHIVPELQAIQEATALEKTILLPENPSKKRIIRNGIYYVDEIPIDRTLFASDPEFPIKTAAVSDILTHTVELNPDDSLSGKGVYIANASTQGDIMAYLTKKDSNTFLAGGADLFTCFLKNKGYKENARTRFKGLGNKNSLIVCGSSVKHAFMDQPYFERKEIPVCNMPLTVFQGNSNDDWLKNAIVKYEKYRSLILAIAHSAEKEKHTAVRLKETMARTASALVAMHPPEELIIEGGATAFALLLQLKWNQFSISEEIDPGVVRMAVADSPEIHVTLKPGSYSWGDNLFL